MMRGSLVDLDSPSARERRWPFYAVWMIGGVVVGAALLSHLPPSITHAAAPVVTEPPAAAPATPQLPSRFRVAPLPLDRAPARP